MATVLTTGFHLQFPAAELPALVHRYQYGDDQVMLAAGRRIAEGDFARTHLATIFRWKTGGRGISRLQRNQDAEVEDALQLAAQAKTDRAAIAVLLGLHGVQIPVASAILTALDPTRFTIIDFRALQALGIQQAVLTVNLYLDYLQACRTLAQTHGLSLRDLDRALWQWSKEQPT